MLLRLKRVIKQTYVHTRDFSLVTFNPNSYLPKYVLNILVWMVLLARALVVWSPVASNYSGGGVRGAGAASYRASPSITTGSLFVCLPSSPSPPLHPYPILRPPNDRRTRYRHDIRYFGCTLVVILYANLLHCIDFVLINSVSKLILHILAHSITLYWRKSIDLNESK